MLTVDALACGIVTADALSGITIDSQRWLHFTILITAAHIHQLLTRAPEERRRAAHGSEGLHGDLTSIFTFPAAVLLPLPLTIVLIVSVRAARFAIARKPLFRWLLSSSSIVLAACSAHAISAHALGTPSSGNHDLLMQAALASAAFVFVGQQMLIVAGAKMLSATDGMPSAVELFGDREHLADVTLSITLGMVLASTAANPLTTMGILVVATSINTLITHRERGRRDGGTGLITKARWEELANAAIHAAARTGHGVALLVVDLDHFKNVNDQHGHLVGDMLLQRVADVLAQSTRAGDLAGRYGGEEFVVLLNDADEALHAAERIRSRISKIVLVFEEKRGGGRASIEDRTASIGVAVAPPQSPMSLSNLFKAADQALYQAKRQGRDQVLLAEPEATSALQTLNSQI